MKVRLVYFQSSGKYFSEGEYETEKENLCQIFAEVREMSQDGRLPGLVFGCTEFHVLINVPKHPQHPYNHPRLILVEKEK